MNLGSLNVQIGADFSGLTQGLYQAQSQVKAFAATTGGLTQGMNQLGAGSLRTGYALRSGVGAVLSELGVSGGGAARSLGLVTQGLGTLGTAGSAAAMSLGIGLVAALVAVGAASVKASVEFNAAMANVATLIPGNIERVKELKTSVQDLAIATGTSTDDISKGLYQVISAYGDTADTAKTLQLVTEASIAGLSNVEEALKLVSTQTKAYGDNSLAAQKHVADLDFLTVRLGQTTFPQLAAAMPKVEELSHSLGVAQEEVNAIFATTSGVMGGAARAATQLSSVETALLKPTTSMKALFAAVGVESGEELVKKFGSLQRALQFIIATAKASHQPLGDFIGRAEGIKTALFLAGEGAADYQTKLDAMQHSTGAMKAALKEQQDGINQVGADWKKLKEVIVVASQDIGDAIVQAFGGHRTLGALVNFSTWLSRTAKAYSAWRDPAKAVQLGADFGTRQRELGEAGGREFGDAGLRAELFGDLAPAPAKAAPNGGIKGAVLPDKKALAALASEQARYTQELLGAHERLTTLLAGEGNIAGQVAARYHLLTEAQRDNLTAVLKSIEHQTQLNAVQAHTESNARVRALLARGESVEVAKLGGQYSQLSTSELRAAFASEKATEAAIRAAESHKAYAKDIGTLNAEIRRLKQGHDAEASGVDALREKYPGLSTAMLGVMNNAIQWKKHLTDLHQEAHKVAEEIRGLQLRILEAGAGSKVEEAAASLFGGRILERGGRPGSAAALYRGLDAGRRGQAQQYAGQQMFSDVDAALRAARQGVAERETPSGFLQTRTGMRTQQLLGPNWQDALSGPNAQIIQQKIADLVKVEQHQRQVAATSEAMIAEWNKQDQVIGASGVNLEIFQQQLGVLTGKSATAREVMEKFGVSLRDLPKDTQRSVRALLELQHRLDFFRDFAQGTQQVFENMFHNLFEHGFKGFFQNVIQGFNQMLQQIAAKYLASRLTDLVIGAVGSIFGGGGGGGGGGNSWTGHAMGGSVQAGGRYMVGEQGPELFVPRTSGSIVPHNQLAGAGANITINVHGVTDAASFRRNTGAITADMERALRVRSRRDG